MDWAEFVALAKDVVSLVTLAALIIKPIRQRLFRDKAEREGLKCLLRSEILRTYYRHLETHSMRQYEYQNMCACYEAYKALGGNSFVDHIYREMQEWVVHS